jgi:choline dehydrogenase-like flavoprotein
MSEATEGPPYRVDRLSRRAFLAGVGGATAVWTISPNGVLEAVSQPKAASRRRPRFLSTSERGTAAALFDALVPPVAGRGGARAARAVEYLDLLLGSDLTGRPPLYHLGPFSGRSPYPARCAPGKRFPSDGFRRYRSLDRVERVAWALRLDGSAAHPRLDRNTRVLGPVVGWRERYRRGLRELDRTSTSLFSRPFADLDPVQREEVIATADQSFVGLAYAHAVEGTYSAPEYGGNSRRAGWLSIGFEGDRQPLGYVDPASGCELAPVSGPGGGGRSGGPSLPAALDPEAVWRIASTALHTLYRSDDLRRPVEGSPGAGRRRGVWAPGRSSAPVTGASRSRAGGESYDAVIVGSGPGASMTAYVLSRAGWRVLVLERGPNPYRALGRGPASEFTNDELKAFQRRYGWPDPLTEPRTFRPSRGDEARTHVGPVNDLPAMVGGGAGLATMLVPRMREVDFLPRTRFGDVPGSILIDWPITYRDLAPHYDAVERLLGVQGRADDPFASPRRRRFPLRPGVPLYANEVIAQGAERLGIPAPTAPLAITSKAYQGRAGCNECGRCWSYGCPIGAHAGMASNLLGRAVATGRCKVAPGRFASAIEASGRRATAVHYLDRLGREHAVRARFVLLGGGPMEDARLLLLSGLDDRDRSGLMGRGLVFHFQTFAGGYFSRERLHSRRGRGLSRMFTEFSGPPTLAGARGWAGVPGGGVVEISGLGLLGPIAEGQTYPRGGAHAGFMAANLFDDHIAGLLMQGEDLPQRETLVDLDPDVVDLRGIAVARLTYQPHPFEIAASSHYGPRLAEILLAAGADGVAFGPKNAPAGAPSPEPLELPDVVQSVLDGLPGPGGIAAGPFAPTSPVPNTQHILSGFRMGRDPDLSVCNPWGRLHGFDNLYCVDGGLLCSSTPVNPTLTIWALSHRIGKRLARRRP